MGRKVQASLLAMTWALGLASAEAQAQTAAKAPAAGQVTLYRDRMGVPHVYGQTEVEAFYGAGYALGQDRLVQSELGMRRARGRMAEIMGPSAVNADREARIQGRTDAELQAAFDAMPAEHQRMVQAVVDGLNAAIAEAAADPDNKTPYEFKEWGVRPQAWSLLDYVASISANWRGYGSAGGNELVNLEFYNELVARHGAAKAKVIFDDVLPLDDPSAVPIISEQEFTFAWPKDGGAVQKAEQVRPVSDEALRQYAVIDAGRQLSLALTGERDGASRAFVVSGKRSASGRAMLMEATSENPDVHYVGGRMNAVGFTTPPGIPPLMGRSLNHAWLSTTGESDMVDIFAERLNPANPREYWHKGAWRPMEVRTEVIKVKGAADQTVEVERTVHGPVVARDAKNGVAYAEANALAGYEMQNWVARLELTRAGSLAEFERAVKTVPTNTNILYGDAQGNIAVWHAGRLPIRDPGVDPRLPTPGDGEHEWRGFVPADKLPHVINPKAGFLHAWNNKPAAGLTYGDTSRYGKTFRTWVGVSLGQGDPSISMDDMREFNRKMGRSAGGTDLSVTGPQYFTPFLAEAAGDDPRLKQAVALMGQWNGIFEDMDDDGRYDSPGLTLFRTWVDVAQAAIIAPTIGEWWHKIDDRRYIKYRTEVLLRAIEGAKAGVPMAYDWYQGRPRNEVIRETLVRTLEKVEKAQGGGDMAKWRTPIYWKYYDASKRAANPDKPTYPGSGGMTTTPGRVGAIPFAIPANLSESWNVLMEVGGPQPQVMLSSTPLGGQSQFINTAGKAGPHVGDQVELHQNFRFKTVPMDANAVAAEAESVVTLTLPKRSGR